MKRLQNPMLCSCWRTSARNLVTINTHSIGWNPRDRTKAMWRETSKMSAAQTNAEKKTYKTPKLNCEKQVIQAKVIARVRNCSSSTDLSSICENPKRSPSRETQRFSSKITGMKNTNGRTHIRQNCSNKVIAEAT